jgi:transposase
MREECSISRRKRRQFTPEFQAEAVRLTQVGDRSIAKVADDLDLTETSLREWVKPAEADAGRGAPDALATLEREELTPLRRRTRRSAWSAKSRNRRPPSSRRREREVRVHPFEVGLPHHHPLSGARRVRERLPSRRAR